VTSGWLIIIALVVGGLVVTGLLCRWLLDNPRHDVTTGIMFHAVRLYSRRTHRLRVEGGEYVPESREPGPYIVVANHTSGVDPLLIQAGCPFEIRWLMAQDMRVGFLEPLWRWARVIFIDREAPNLTPLREALRHLRDGGVIGIFPEGGIERPSRAVLPFMRGVGVLIKRSGAPILPVLIRGTPEADTAWGSLTTSSSSTIRFLQPVLYDLKNERPDEIAEDLRERFMEWSGWPANDEPASADTPGGKPPRG